MKLTKELQAELGDVIWRLRDIREMLTGLTYRCDEWSTPIVNLDIAIAKVEKLQVPNAELTG